MIPPDAEPETEPETESQAQGHFIELATRRLEDQPEIRDEARGELMGRLSAVSPPEREAALEAALPQLAKVIPASWRGKAISLAVAWVVLASVVGWQGYGIFREIMVTKESVDEILSRRMASYTASHPAGWTSAASTPAALAAELEAQSHGGHDQPDNLAELCKGLDPDNGAWALLEANWKFPPPSTRSTAPPPEEWWKLLEEAANAPRFETYSANTRLALMQDLPPPDTMLALGLRRDSFDGYPLFTDPSPAFLANRVHKVESARDLEGLRATIRVWERLCVRLADAGATIGEIDSAVRMVSTGMSLAQAAGRLGMSAEEEKIRRQMAMIGSDAAYGMSFEPSYPMMVRQKVVPGAEPDAAACAPGREIEYAFAERVLAVVAALLVVLALALVAFESVRRGRRVNGLASGLSPLFTGGDGLWLLGLGLLAPVAWYWGITRLSPFGCRDLAIDHTNHPWILSSAVAGLLLLFSLAVQTALWRIARRSGFLGIAPKRLWPGWAVVAIAAILVPLPGAIRWLPEWSHEKFFISSGVSCGIPLLWLLWRAGALLFSPGTSALGGVLLSRAVALPLLLGAVFLLAASGFLKQREKDIIASDPVAGWDAARGISRQEARSVDYLRNRFHEVFADESPAAPSR